MVLRKRVGAATSAARPDWSNSLSPSHANTISRVSGLQYHRSCDRKLAASCDTNSNNSLPDFFVPVNRATFSSVRTARCWCAALQGNRPRHPKARLPHWHAQSAFALNGHSTNQQSRRVASSDRRQTTSRLWAIGLTSGVLNRRRVVLQSRCPSNNRKLQIASLALLGQVKPGIRGEQSFRHCETPKPMGFRQRVSSSLQFLVVNCAWEY
jgi:hypothetical protein